MKIIILAYDHQFSDKSVINGNTATCYHYCEAFKRLGHDSKMVEYNDNLEEADVYMVASEWYAAQLDFWPRRRGKLIVWMGHWIGGVYYDPTKIDADLYITTWQGELVDDYERKTGKKVHYVPHAFGEDSGGVKRGGDIVFAGNTYPLRDESILDTVNISRLQGIMPWEMPAYYRGAKICLNFHGDFQRGAVATHGSRLATIPGYALNERTFQTTGAGGFQLCQEHPLLEGMPIETFTDAKDLKEKIDYWLAHDKERQQRAEEGREYIINNHTYLWRAKRLLDLLQGR